jgi:hypothetical protein
MEASNMVAKETVKNVDEKREQLFEMANRDPELKKMLIRDPRAVAEKYGVKFSDEEVLELQKLAGIADLVDEVKFGRLYPRPPIFYPIHVWQINDLLEIFSKLIPSDFVGGIGPIFYPAPDYTQRSISMTRAAYPPGWVSYPGDDQGGGGSWKGGGIYGGGVVPGPIFYPAGLRNILKERLIQILQVKQMAGR